ncbi:MAG: hypothetical protein HRU19_00180 [Pseudobacteriovorax sp.]|nr:hypothetical protein [Pseudobacteriovorax sp.]
MARNLSNPSEIKNRLEKFKKQLERLNDVKKLLISEGIPPDADDKEKESRLIQKIMGLEKDLKRLSRSQSKSQDKSAQKPTKQPFAKAKGNAQKRMASN